MIIINVVNTNPIITGKHNPTMSGKHRPAIDKILTRRLNRYFQFHQMGEAMDLMGNLKIPEK